MFRLALADARASLNMTDLRWRGWPQRQRSRSLARKRRSGWQVHDRAEGQKSNARSFRPTRTLMNARARLTAVRMTKVEVSGNEFRRCPDCRHVFRHGGR